MEEEKQTPTLEELKPTKKDFYFSRIYDVYHVAGLENPKELAQKACDEYVRDFEEFTKYYSDKLDTAKDHEIFLDHARYLTVAGYHKFGRLIALQDQYNFSDVKNKEKLHIEIEELQSNFTYWRLQGVYEITDEALESGQTGWMCKLEGALGLPHELDYDRARYAYDGTSMRPQDRAVGVQQGFAVETRQFLGANIHHAKSDKQKQVLLDQLIYFKQKYLEKQLTVLAHRAGTMSAAITGSSNFPTKRNRAKLDRVDIEERDFMKWYNASFRYAKSAILNAATDEEKKELAWRKYQKGIIEDVAVIIDIDNGDMAGFNRTAFVNGTARKIRALPTVELVSRALRLVEEFQKDMKKPVFTSRHSVWNAANDLAQTIEEEAIEIEKGDSVLMEFAGGEMRDTPSCDRIQIYFEDKPSERVRKALKSAAWRWSPTNEVWQRKRTDNAINSAKMIVKKTYMPEYLENSISVSVIEPVQKDDPFGLDKAVNEIIEDIKKKDGEPLVCAGSELKFQEPGGIEKSTEKVVSEEPTEEKIPEELTRGKKDKKPLTSAVEKIKKVEKVDYTIPFSMPEKQEILRQASVGFIVFRMDNDLKVMTDDEIEIAWSATTANIRKEFMNCDSIRGDKPVHYMIEPHSLKIWASFDKVDVSKNKPFLSGKKTVKWLREIFKIPDPDAAQGDLFL